MTVVDETLLDWFRSRDCDLCGKRGPSDPHHVKPRGHGGGSRRDVVLNILSVCRKCHQKAQTGGEEGQRLCWEAIARREGIAAWTTVRNAVNRLLRPEWRR